MQGQSQLPRAGRTFAALQVLSLLVYIASVRSQNGLPAWWVFALMCLIAIGAAVSSVLNQRRQRRVLLAVASVIATELGVITLTSIGGPLILTAALGVIAIAVDSG